MRLKSAVISLLSFCLYLGSVSCTKSDQATQSGSQTLSLTANAHGLVSNSSLSLQALKFQLQGIKDGSITGDPQSLVDQILGAFPVKPSDIIKAIDAFLAAPDSGLSAADRLTLQGLRNQLAGSGSNSGSSSSLLVKKNQFMLTDLSLSGLMDLIGAIELPKIDDIIGRIDDLIDIIKKIDDIIKKIHDDLVRNDPLPPNGPPPLNQGGGRMFGPTNCPGIINRYAGGWVPEPAPCRDYAMLKNCMKNDKIDECKARCNPNAVPIGFKCNPARGAVTEVDCNAPPADWVGLCGTLGGNTTATCMTDGGQLRDTFPVGFWICTNPAMIPDPAFRPPVPVADPGVVAPPVMPPMDPPAGGGEPAPSPPPVVPPAGM